MRAPWPDILQQPVTHADAARALIEAGLPLAAQLRRPFRGPPSEPTTCCGRGCNGCVWEGYVSAVEYWRSDLLATLKADKPDR